jgi:pimeloyl-ACP methyl ester carboxylesterase
MSRMRLDTKGTRVQNPFPQPKGWGYLIRETAKQIPFFRGASLLNTPVIKVFIALALIFFFSILNFSPTYAHAPPRRITAATQQGNSTWLGSTEGLWRYENSQLIPIELPFLDPHITALYHDGSALWVGTYSHIGRYSPGEGWQTWERGQAGLPSAWARGFTTYQGQVMAGTYDRGVVRWDGQMWQSLANSPLRITALASDNASLYATTVEGMTYRYDGTQWQVLAEDVTFPATLPALPTLPVTAIAKPPIVLIHGLGDSNQISDSNLRFLAQWLEDDGYAVYYVEYSPTDSLLTNRSQVAATVATARQEHPAQQPILIAHSFGGLLARTYLATAPDAVAGFVTLGTPHAGVRLAYDMVVSDMAEEDNPQLRELLPEHTTLLEPFWANADIPQLHIGGDVLPRADFFEGFPPHDGIVDTASAVAAPGATRIYPLLHGWTVATMRYGLDAYLAPQTLYFATIRPFLVSLENSPPTNRALTPLLSAPGFTQRPVFVGVLEPNLTQTTAISLNENAATWILDAAGVDMTLIAPDGTRYVGAETGVGLAVSHLPYRENVLQPLDLWSTAQAGTWQVELTNTNFEAVSARLTVIQPQQPPLNVSVLNGWVAPGENVTIEAQGLPDQSLIAFSGATQIPLEQVTPGLYRATFAAPLDPGYHPLRVSKGSEERWAVVTVRSEAFQTDSPTVTRTDATVTLQLPVTGNGAAAVGMRIRQGEATIAATLQPVTITNNQTLTIDLPVAASAQDIQVEWQLFDANGALVPVTNMVGVE